MSHWFSYLFPWLLLIWMLDTIAWRSNESTIFPQNRWVRAACLGLVSALVVSLPVSRLALGRWLAGLNLPPSVPLMGFLVVILWTRLSGKQVFRPKDWAAGWVIGGVAGIFLYPLSLGLCDFDPYQLGWAFSPLFLLIALISIYLLWRGNRFGLLLLGAALAYDLRCLESQNLWDYLVDPVYWVLSLIFATKFVLRDLRPKQVQNSLQERCTTANAR